LNRYKLWISVNQNR